MTRPKKRNPTGGRDDGGSIVLNDGSVGAIAAIGRAIAAGELKPGFGVNAVEPVGQFHDGMSTPSERQRTDDEAMLANMRAARDRLIARDGRVSQSAVATEAGYSRNGKAFKRLHKQL